MIPTGNVTSITPPGRPAHEFLYTSINLEETYEPPALDPMPTPAVPDPNTYFAYNADGQMTQITRPDGGTIVYSYDPDTGQLESKALPGGQETLSYTYHPPTALNGAGLVETITAPDGGTLTYSYLGELLFQESWDGAVDGSVERVYDNHQRVAAQSVNSASSVTFGYDADGFMTAAGALTMSRHPQHGLLTGTTLGDVTDSYGRNDFGEVTQYVANYDGTPVLEIEYERDQVGRIVKKTESVEGGSPVETHYQYDMAGRLYRVCDDAACNEVRSEYQYDLNSNRIDGFTPSGAIDATYDSQDRLLTYNGATYTYTANGELASKTEGSDTTTYQ
jgi:YD repeat-containing protein